MKAQPVTLYLPDSRDVVISNRWTRGNNKLGPDVYTYSRVSGSPKLQHFSDNLVDKRQDGTCPGATVECEAICYATRINGEVRERVYPANGGNDVPPIPDDAKIIRVHVSGDFDTPEYILNWVKRLKERPDVTFWGYTRSWRCASLLEFLEQLRALPNVQLFASMDPSCVEMPPTGWRRSWIWRDAPNGPWPVEARLTWRDNTHASQLAVDGAKSLVCPEERGTMPDCQTCQYCFRDIPGDVTFLEH